MPAEIVVLGGGVGGTLAANLLSRRIPDTEARVRVVDLTGRHAYQPGWLYLALDRADSRWLNKDVRSLLDDPVELLIDDATSIDADNRTVFLGREGVIDYDYLVLATGSRLDRHAVRGLAGGTHDFYSLDGAERLREALRTFDGGRILVGAADRTYKCPPSLLEFTFLLEQSLRKRGLRDRTTLTYLSPFEQALEAEGADKHIEPRLARRNIASETGVQVTAVDAAEQLLEAANGSRFGYELAVVAPPHRGAQVVVDSALTDERGWLPVDRETLQAGGLADVFALGDCTDAPVAKAGSTAHFEAPVITEQIAARVAGREPDPVESRYYGKVRCWLEVGGGKATMVRYDYSGPARVARPSRRMHAAKWLFNRAYWSTVPRGRF